MTDSETPAPEAPQPGATHLTEQAAFAERGPQTTATSQADPEPSPSEVKATEDPSKAAPPPPPKRDYAAERQQQRIDRLTAQLRATQTELERAHGTQSSDAAAIQQQIDAKATELAAAKATEIVAWNAFTGSLNSAIAEGQKEFGAEKFDAAVAQLRTLHDHADPEANSKYLSMLQAVLDTGAAPKLIAQLGEDPNEAARIMGLSPTKMGVELGKLAFRDAAAVSDAPKPVRPVTGVGRTHVAIAAEDPDRADSIDMRVWMERRMQHVGEVNKRAGRRVIP